MKYSHRQVVRKGKKDGRNWKWKFWPFVKQDKPQSPRPGQTEPAAFEKELIQVAEGDISREAEKWMERDRELKPKYCQALVAVKAAKQKFHKEDKEAQAALKAFETAEAEYKKLELPPVSSAWRNFWLFFIAVAEFPLNSVVFALFGAGKIETFIMAAGLCVAIPVIAHFFGQALRQEHKSLTDKALMITMPLIMLLILGAIAFIRAKYFQAARSYNLIGVEMSPTAMTTLFIIINMAIFLVAVLVSYEGTHPDHRFFRAVVRRYREALKKLRKEGSEAESAGRELAQAEQRFQQIRQQRLKIYQQHAQRARTLQQTGEWLAATYRAANLRVRNDFPECLKGDVPSPVIPQELLNLDWDCPETSFESPQDNISREETS